MPEKSVTIDLGQLRHQLLLLVAVVAAVAVVFVVALAWTALHRRNRDAVDAPPIVGRALARMRLGYRVATAALAMRAVLTVIGHWIVLAGGRVSARRTATRHG